MVLTSLISLSKYSRGFSEKVSTHEMQKKHLNIYENYTLLASNGAKIEFLKISSNLLSFTFLLFLQIFAHYDEKDQ